MIVYHGDDDGNVNNRNNRNDYMYIRGNDNSSDDNDDYNYI